MGQRAYDIENERAIIASCLVDPSIRRRSVGAVRPEDFIGDRFRAIFRAIVECERNDLIPDNEAIAVHAADEDWGGTEFLQTLRECEPTKNLDFHLDRLRFDAARVRAADDLLPDLSLILGDRTKDHGECLKKAAEVVDALRVERVRVEDATGEYNDDLDRRCAGETHFVSTGYPALDDVLVEGYGPGSITVLGGRTGNGKSTFAVDTVRRMLKGQYKPRILMVPLEIGRIRFLDKLASSATLIPTVMLRKHPEELRLAEREEIKRVTKKMIGTDDRLTVLDHTVYFNVERDTDDKKKWSNEGALDRTESILAEGNYDIAIFDLWQRSLLDLRASAIETALIRTQHLAKRYQTHIVIVHQISRKADERKGKRPELTDLKGSGGYEEIADLVLLVHRPKAYTQFMKADNIEVHVAKQRDGPAGMTMKAEFLPTVSRLEGDHLAGEDKKPETSEEGDTVI